LTQPRESTQQQKSDPTRLESNELLCPILGERFKVRLNEIEKLRPIQQDIIRELGVAIGYLTNDDMNLQMILNSWGDTVPEKGILEMLVQSNNQ
jgi:hypothetical protein